MFLILTRFQPGDLGNSHSLNRFNDFSMAQVSRKDKPSKRSRDHIGRSHPVETG
jgi:hypothetical protein